MGAGCNNQLSPELNACPSCGAPTEKGAAAMGGATAQKKTPVIGSLAVASAVVTCLIPSFTEALLLTVLTLVLGVMALAKEQKRTGIVALIIAALSGVGILHMSYKAYLDKAQLHQAEQAQVSQNPQEQK
jgi:hypothetical protein